MSDAEVKFKFTPEPQKLTTALDDAEKKAKKAETGIQSFLSTATTQSSGWSSALGGVTKAFGAITAIVSAGKILSFMSDATDKAQELENQLEEVEKGSASLGESLDSIKGRLDESMENIGTLVTDKHGKFLLNIQKLVYGTYANIAKAVEDAFVIKNADKIEESYDKQNKALERIGDELDRLSKIQKRTAEEELQFIKLKEEMTGQLDKLGMSYTTLAQRTTSYKDAMVEAAKVAKRQAQDQLWSQAQMLRQPFNARDRLERDIEIEQYQRANDVRNTRYQMLIRERAEDRRNDEKRIKLARDLEKRALELGKEKPETKEAPAVTPTEINEQRFIQSRNKLIQIENNRIDTANEARRAFKRKEIDEEERNRRIKNANEDARIMAEQEVSNLRSVYAVFIEDKAMMDAMFIQSQTNQAIRASEEIFEAEMKRAEQLHKRRIADDADENESSEEMEREFQRAKIENEDRLKKIRMQNVAMQSKAALDSMNQTMQAATGLTKGLAAFKKGDFAAGFSGVGAGIGGIGKGLSSLGIIDAGGTASQVFQGLGMAGQVLSIGTTLTSAIGSLFGKSDEQRAREAQDQKRRDEEAQRILELQAVYQKNMLALQEQSAKLPFENLQRKLRLTEIQASQKRIAGVDETQIESERLSSRSAAIQQTLTEQSMSIAQGQLFTNVQATPESLIQFLSERGAQASAISQFISYAEQLRSLAMSNNPSSAIIAQIISYMESLRGNLPTEIYNSVFGNSAAYDFLRHTQWLEGSGLQWSYQYPRESGGGVGATLHQVAANVSGALNLGSEVTIDTSIAENLLSTIEQGNQVQLEIAANTKKTAQNTTLQLEKDRSASFIDIAGGGIRGFGQLLAGNFGLNTNALTLPTGISNAMLASQGMQTLEEKSYSALKSLVGVSEDMRELLAEIALNTNRTAGNIANSLDENSLLSMLDRFKQRS